MHSQEFREDTLKRLILSSEPIVQVAPCIQAIQWGTRICPQRRIAKLNSP